MIPEIDQQTGFTTVGGLAACWLFFKKFLVKNKAEDVNLQAEGAHMDVITLMRDELNRANDSNKRLRETIDNFIRITKELTAAIHGLQEENIMLKSEVSILNKSVTELEAKLESIRTRKTDVHFKSNHHDRRSHEAS